MADQPKVSVLLELIDRLTAPVQGIEGRMKSFGNTLGNIGKAIGAAFTAAAIFKFAKDSVSAFLDAEDSVARLSTALHGLGISYKDVGPAIEDTLKKIQRTTKYGDDDAREALTRLIAMTGNYGQSVQDLGLVADVAAYKHTTMAEAAELVGKVHQGNTKALREFGISATGAADGMDKLRTVTQGFADAEAKTLAGAIAQAKNQFDEFLEAVGRGIAGNDDMAGSVRGLAETFANLATWVDEHSELFRGIGSLITGVATAAGHILGMALEGFQRIGERLGLIEVEGTKVVTREETARSLAVKAAAAARGKARATATRQELDAEEAARKKSHATILEIEKLSADAQITVVKSMADSYAGILEKMWAKVGETRGKDHERALAAIAAVKDALITQWLQSAVPAIKTTTDTVGKFHLTLVDTSSTFAELDGALDRYVLATTGMTRTDIEALRAKEQLAASIERVASQIVHGVERVQNVAHNLASIFGQDVVEAVDRAASSISTMADGLADVMHGDWIGGITKGVGAAVNLIKGLFGKSEAEKKLEATLNKNNDRLNELRGKIGDLLGLNATGRQIAGTQSALQEFFATGGGGQKGWGDRLGQLLLARGLTMKDVEELANTLQINIQPNGHLDPNALRQLLAGIGAVEPTTFAQTFGGQRERIRSGVDLGAITDELAEAVKLIADPKLGAPAIASALAGLDLGTASGKASAITALKDLFTNIDKVGAAGLGGLTGAEFLDSLQWLIKLLGATDAIAGGGVVVPPIGSGDMAGGGNGAVSTFTWDKLFDVEAESRDYLRTIRDAVTASANASFSANASVEFSGDIIVNGGGDVDGVTAAVTLALDARTRQIEEALAQNYLRAQSLTGSAVRI